MYSTCTIDKRENIENIERFLKENKNIILDKINLKNSDVKVKENGVLEIVPDDYNCDGFFITLSVIIFEYPNIEFLGTSIFSLKC